MAHLVMFTENGRTVMKRVSSAEYAELKAARAVRPMVAVGAEAAPVQDTLPFKPSAELITALLGAG